MNVLLHIGLPKTATTTLQKNLFLVLHERGVINFIGRCSMRNEDDYYNPVEEVLKGVMIEGDELFNGKIDIYRKIIADLLKGDMLNVISEEAITLPRKNYDIEKIFRRINLVFDKHCLSFIVFLRRQVELIYSYYVEMYKWRFFSDLNNSTFEKYYNNIFDGLEKDESCLYDYAGLLKSLLKYYEYDKINVFLFEDFVNEKEVVLKKMALILNYSYEAINELIAIKSENVKKKVKGNYVSDKVDANQYFKNMTKRLFRYRLFIFAKDNIYDNNYFFIKDLSTILIKYVMKNIIIKKGVVHRKMNEFERDKIKDMYIENNLEVCKLLGLSEKVMAKYGYI